MRGVIAYDVQHTSPNKLQLPGLTGATSTLAAMSKEDLDHLLRVQRNALTMTERTLQLRGHSAAPTTSDDGDVELV